MTTPGTTRHVPFSILFLLVLLTVGAIAVVASGLPARQNGTERRIAYAATATAVAAPIDPETLVPVSPTVATQTNEPLPTPQDLAILPTPYPEEILAAGLPTRTPLYPEHTRYELVNILVLGSDQRGETRTYRTDVIVIVSVNWTARTVNLLSIPRDLYVYVPGWGMDRINTAELHQTQIQETHHRLGLLAETIEYNFGIRVDHIARIDFQGFEQLVDLVGGITVPIDCPVSGYQLAADGSEWLPFTLTPGLYNLNGDMTLWYVRQRIDSSDFDRNRRQQIVLRALWHRIASTDILAQLPTLWEFLSQTIETDLTLDQVLLYAPLILELDSRDVEGHFIGLDEVNLWQAPNGANVLVIDPEPFALTVHRFLTPPLENALHAERATVEVVNASSLTNADQLAASQLQWAGLIAIPLGATENRFERTILYDYSGAVKGSSVGAILSTLGLDSSAISVTQPAREGIDFTVVIGENYQSCMTDAWRAFAQSD